MQNGSITRSPRLGGPDVWEFRWREAGPDGKRKHRRIVIGSIAQFSDKSSALVEVSALRREINLNDPRLSLQPVTVSELVNHYRQRELATDHTLSPPQKERRPVDRCFHRFWQKWRAKPR